MLQVELVLRPVVMSVASYNVLFTLILMMLLHDESS